MIPKIITQQFLDKQIQSTEFKLDETEDKKWCVCILTIENGFKVIGQSHRQFDREHNETIAKSSAYSNACDKLWDYYTFLSHVLYVGNLAPQIETNE